MTRVMRLILGLAWCLAAGGAQAADERAAVSARLAAGATAFEAGDVAAASAEWGQAIILARQIGAADLVASGLVRRGEARRVIGHLIDAETDLREAVAVATQSGDQALVAAADGALGSLQLAQRHADAAEPLLVASRDLARRIGDKATLAASSSDLGNLYAASNRAAQAETAYAEAITAALAAGDDSLAATGEVNTARLAVQRNDAGTQTAMVTRALDRLEHAAPSYDRGLVLLSAGWAVLDQNGALSPEQSRLAQRAFAAAGTMAAGLRNPQLASMAEGALGRLYERTGKPREATAPTDRAAFAAQEASAPELSYRWAWQQARLAKTQGRSDEALADYRRAVAALQSIRQDIPVEYRDGQSSYRVTFGPLYLEFADLLLQRARADKAQAPALLREARETVEALKASELHDYYRDSCIANFEARRQSIDTVGAGTAALYPIVLTDRLELIVSIGKAEHQFTIPLSEAQLGAEVRQLRPLLEKRTTNEYLPLSRQLYDQIIRPIVPLLTANNVGTLVIVPDNVLRLVPFGALQDGNQFLIERYAVAVVPGLHLVDPRPLTAQARDALVLGLSQAVQGFAALPHVADEVSEVEQINGGKVLLDETFRRSSFEGELKGEPYNIVHIASHGNFGSEPSRTYVLAYDGRLTMDDLEKTIKYGQYRDRALELLTLDACETAAGDDRAALGLAGVALKSGARSALATLWFISDRASGELAVRFYQALKAGHLSKAQALQAAQRDLIADPRFSHPAYWAPFLLIGNWL